jgi:hypothetical protein
MADTPKRIDYKKSPAPKPNSRQDINSYSEMGKGLNIKSLTIFDMSKGDK